jgi:RNA polymerase sigma-70 factor (ECF subfamily)
MLEKFKEEKPAVSVNKIESDREDRQLVIQACGGDKEAYGRLVLKYQERLYRFLFIMLGSIDIVEEIAQDAFVKGYLSLARFDPERPFYPWIATIARNDAINYLKRSKKERPASECEDLLRAIPDKTAGPLDNILEKEMDRKFSQAVMALPEKYRVVFALRMFEEMSYEEIARELDLSVGTVDSRLFRAREKLIEILKDYL